MLALLVMNRHFTSSEVLWFHYDHLKEPSTLSLSIVPVVLYDFWHKIKGNFICLKKKKKKKDKNDMLKRLTTYQLTLKQIV